jgi:JAB N-terminal domain
MFADGDDYLYRQIFVEGPDGRSFAFGDVPAATAVRQIAGEMARRYHEGMPGAVQAAVVDHVGGGGAGRRLDPDSTLHEEGVSEGSRLRVGFRRQAAAAEPVIEVFRGDDYLPDGEIPLLPVLRDVFGEITGPDSDGVAFDLFFYELTDHTEDHGKPSLVNLRPSHGFVQVRIWRDGELLYTGRHPVRELIGEPLRELLRTRDPDVGHWGYGVRGPGMEGVPLTRPAPEVIHEVRVGAGSHRPPVFTVEPLPEPEPPRSSLAALGVPGADDRATAPVAVVIPAALVTSLERTYPFSEQLEEGGFLAGTVYRDAGPGGYLLHVTAVIPAERTGATAIEFTFTGESFLRVSEQLAARADGATLLGWYHTHLFPATPRSGLSAVDAALHRSTFRRPWQIAALLTISAGGRELTFYHGGADGEMTQVPYWPVPG